MRTIELINIPLTLTQILGSISAEGMYQSFRPTSVTTLS